MKITSMTAILFAIPFALAAYAAGSDDTQKFFEEAASANKLEVESGRLAAQKASNPQLKAFAQEMVTDHTKAGQELQALAARKRIQLPIAMSDDHQQKLEKLRAKTGKDFDQEFRDLMVDSHEEAVSLFENTAKDAQDPEVKAFATKMLPTLQRHERHANTLPKA